MANIFKKIAGYANPGQINLSADNENDEETDEEAEDGAFDENYDEDEEAADEEESEEEAMAVEETPTVQAPAEREDDWIGDGLEEGQLSIDVYQTPDAIVVKSTIAGVMPEDIDISINNDMLTIRGRRVQEEDVREENYLYKECYWGNFSRSIILPVEVESDKIEAFLENGVLTVVLPKARSAKPISIKVRGR
jgi:HSP20 family protein